MAQLYTGVLGSEASRFPGQDTTDIHLTDWNNGLGPWPKFRQHASCVAQGVTILYYEFKANAAAPWLRVPALFNGQMSVVDHGMIPPAIPTPAVPVVPNFTFVGVPGGIQPVMGFPVLWYHIVTVNYLPGGVRQTLHYHQHTKRKPGRHTPADMPTLVPGGTHHEFQTLEYNTHIQQFRQAK